MQGYYPAVAVVAVVASAIDLTARLSQSTGERLRQEAGAALRERARTLAATIPPTAPKKCPCQEMPS